MSGEDGAMSHVGVAIGVFILVMKDDEDCTLV